MPLPRVVVEGVSSGKDNRVLDLIDKYRQYVEISVPEYWLIDSEY